MAPARPGAAGQAASNYLRIDVEFVFETKVEEQDVALKILHTADWHLGLRFPSFDEADGQADMCAYSGGKTELLGVAESYSVNAVLCAGDLFDTPLPEEHWWKGLVDHFRRRTGVDRPAFLLPGMIICSRRTRSGPRMMRSDGHCLPGCMSWIVTTMSSHCRRMLTYAQPCRSQEGR